MAGLIYINGRDPRTEWGLYLNAIAGREPAGQKLETLDQPNAHGAVMLTRFPKRQSRLLVLETGPGGAMLGDDRADLLRNLDRFVTFLRDNRTDIQVEFDDHPGRVVSGYMESPTLTWQGAWGAKQWLPLRFPIVCPDPFFYEPALTDPAIPLATGTSTRVLAGDVEGDLILRVNGGAAGISGATLIFKNKADVRRLKLNTTSPYNIPANGVLEINTKTNAVFLKAAPTVSKYGVIATDATHGHPHEFRAGPAEDKLEVVQGVTGTWELEYRPRWTFA